MAKAGMRRPDPSDAHGSNKRQQKYPKNEQKPAAELQGHQKSGKAKARP